VRPKVLDQLVLRRVAALRERIPPLLPLLPLLPVWAALQLARGLKDATIVTVIPDRGDRYISTGVFPS